MLYSKDEILAAVRQELAEANRELGIADGFTDEDYKYLGVIAAAWQRLPSISQNSGKPIVSGSVCPDCLMGKDEFEPDWRCPECRRQTDR